MRVIFDTNILVNATLSRGRPPDQAIDFAKKNAIILVSKATRDELISVINNSKFDRFMPRKVRTDYVQAYLAHAKLITPTESFTACRDPKDNKFLDLAVAGQVDYLISGDQDLRILNPFQKIPIVSARDYLARVNRNQLSQP